MTEETGKKLHAAYSALPREEPRAALDAAILAASRRALAKPSASRRWAVPVSIAAVLVLAFGVTLHMREEAPGIEAPVLYRAPASPPPAAAEPAVATAQEIAPQKRAQAESEPKAKLQKKVVPARKPDANPFPREEMRSFRDEAVPAAVPERKDLKEMDMNRAAPATAAVAAAPPPTAAAAPAPQAAARLKREAAPSAQAPSGLVAADAHAPVDEPTRELEAIAKLRLEARHEEADKALAEFRRKRPDYRIADAMWERVKPR